MSSERKTSQLQLRVSPSQKAAIVRAAKQEGVDVSSYVLDRVVSNRSKEFRELVGRLRGRNSKPYVFAAISDFLQRLERREFSTALEGFSQTHLNDEDANYLAAMVEHTAHEKRVRAPDWTRYIRVLKTPTFGSRLSNLRLYLLLASPPAFRRRNIFIDATVGDRI